MTTIKTYAINELTRIGMYNSGEEMNDEMCQHILKIVDVFDEEGHSGFSAEYAIGILQKLLRWEPLSPLTGDDDEWKNLENEGFQDKGFQNKRCSRVFKDEKGGQAYDIRGKVFVNPDGVAFTSRGSRVYIDFPYVPKTEYVNVEHETTED
jgi:hypothetical protein